MKQLHDPVYLGDAVYLRQGSYVGELVLTTEDGTGPENASNTIVLEEPVLRQLLRVLDELEVIA